MPKSISIHWNPVDILPTPNIPLIVELANGNVENATRPHYIKSRLTDDLGYVDNYGISLYTVIKWRYI
jgi:hypothetical protein